MKSPAIILAILITSSTYCFAKKNGIVDVKEKYYGVSVAQVNAGNGHGTGYAFNANINKGRKSLEFGVLYNENEEKLSGADLKYRIMLGDKSRVVTQSNFYQPYLQYNLMYQKGTSYAAETMTLGDQTVEIDSDPATIATIGHYLAYGNKISIFGNAYLDTSIGIGLYQGSINNELEASAWGIHNENGGLTFSLKIGFGYTFN